MRQLREVIVRRRPLQLDEAGERVDEPAAERPEPAQPVPAEPSDAAAETTVRSLAASMRAAEAPAEAEPAPLADVEPPDADDTDESAAAEAEAAEPHAPPRRNIWDIEQDDEQARVLDALRDAPEPDPEDEVGQDDPEDAFAARVKAAAMRREEPMAERPEPRRAVPAEAPRPATNGGSRVKTRILGFHSEEIAVDALSATAERPAATGAFPAGWLVIVEGPGRGTSFTVTAGVSTIGRGEDQTICLDFGDASVSRENHASIAYDEEQAKFFIGHGGKRNIVRRNGNPVLATEELDHGDHVRVGKTELRFVAFCGPEFSWTPAQEDREHDG
jgi:hypothetical protein